VRRAERVFAFDRDEAGDRGAEVLALRLTAEGLEALRIQFPKGEDTNSYARAVRPAEITRGRDPQRRVVRRRCEACPHDALF
jgi:DNA primase